MDDIDRAQRLEEAERENGIASVIRRRDCLQLIMDGHIYCRDCKDRIAAKRLRANPSATRCIECQAAAERMGTL